MKKNKMMRAASALMVATLLTTSVISGTFAKYTTDSTGTDSARIAKWGIGAPASLNFELFATNAFEEGKVSSSDGTKVLAPGTEKEQTINLFTITGSAPEVKYSYTVKLAVNPESSTTIAKLDSLTGFKWTLTAPGKTKTEYDTFSELQSAVNELSESNIAPNSLPTGYTTGNNTMTIGWEWDFDDSGAGTNDTADTVAGNAAAAGSLDTFKLTLTITATQID